MNITYVMKYFNSLNKTKTSIDAGADPGFSNRGGAKDCVHAAAHSDREA